jgi:hypothetical protein
MTAKKSRTNRTGCTAGVREYCAQHKGVPLTNAIIAQATGYRRGMVAVAVYKLRVRGEIEDLPQRGEFVVNADFVAVRFPTDDPDIPREEKVQRPRAPSNELDALLRRAWA